MAHGMLGFGLARLGAIPLGCARPGKTTRGSGTTRNGNTRIGKARKDNVCLGPVGIDEARHPFRGREAKSSHG